MAIELFSIGTELVIGQIQDTNAHWLAQQILQLGGELRRVTMLRDDFDEMHEALSSAVDRETSLILMTGGLGPTPDDMTVAVVAELIGKKVVVSDETVAYFRERRNMPENEELSEALLKMATMPETADVFQNPEGWAPCIRVTHLQSTLMLMPGPPREMKAIFEAHVAPLIAERYSAEVATARVYVTMFEAAVSPLMQKVMERHPNVYLKAYVSLRQADGDTMPVDLVSTSRDGADADAQLKRAIDYFRELVAETGNLFSLEGES